MLVSCCVSFKWTSEVAVCSQVYYHLGAYEESLTYALGAEDLFNVNDNSEFVQTIIGEFTLVCKNVCFLTTAVD